MTPQERVDRAAAQLVLALGFLIPRGTDVMAAIGTELTEYKNAIEHRCKQEK